MLNTGTLANPDAEGVMSVPLITFQPFSEMVKGMSEYQRRIVLAVGGAEIVDCYFGLALGVVEPYFVVNA